MATHDDIVFITENGDRIPVPINMFRKMSLTIEHMITDSNITEYNNPINVPIKDGEIFSKIIEFCKQHYKHPEMYKNTLKKRIKTRNNKFMFPWDEHYFDVDKNILFGLLSGASYFQIDELLKLVCDKISQEIHKIVDPYKKEKLEEGIHKLGSYLGVEHNYTHDKFADLAKKYKWVDTV